MVDKQQTHKNTILIVEDSATQRRLLNHLLTEKGYSVLAECNGKRALSAIRQELPALVISDIMMPEMDGLELCQTIKKDKRLQQIPVLLISDPDHIEAIEKGKAANADGFIYKPFKIDELINKVRMLLNTKETPSSSPQAAPLKEVMKQNHERKPRYDASPLDRSILLDILGDSEASQKEILRDFKLTSEQEINSLKQAMDKNDLQLVMNMAHRLKGASELIGARPLATICRRIEEAARLNDQSLVAGYQKKFEDEAFRLQAYLESLTESADAMNQNDVSILIVEDEAFQRSVLNRMLQCLGISNLNEASNGKEALEIINKKEPDLMVCDLKMPGMDGMELIRHLSRRQKKTAVIIASGMEPSLIHSAETMAQAYGVTILGSIEKPFTRNKLEALLRKYRLIQHKHPMPPQQISKPFSINQIKKGLENQQFEPFFQPKIDIKTSRIDSAEVLARWRHPRKGIIGPNNFIPQMEQNELIDDLTWQIIKKSTIQCREWKEKGFKIIISINLSINSLTDLYLADRLTEYVRSEGIEPHNIILEITESATTTHLANVLENLSRLRMHGFGLSIDDYGTGYSTMQQLMRIAYTELKIDKSFVTNAALHESTRIILASSLEMAQKLRMKTVAEGVESQKDWDFLKELGCDIAQGYFIAKPMPADEFYDWALAWMQKEQKNG